MRWEDFRRSDNVEDRGDAGERRRLSAGRRNQAGWRRDRRDRDREPFPGRRSAADAGHDRGWRRIRRASADTPRADAPAPGYGPQYPARPSEPRTSETRPKDPGKEFVAHVLGDTEDVWGAVFQTMGARYEPPRLVLFRGAVQSACGRATAAVGPFYCPPTRSSISTPRSSTNLSRRFGAPGDFAQAYVIAHEVGHHVQNLTGTMRRFDQQVARQDPSATQRAFDPARAAGGLLRGRLGLFRETAQPARHRRSGRRVSCGGRRG